MQAKFSDLSLKFPISTLIFPANAQRHRHPLKIHVMRELGLRAEIYKPRTQQEISILDTIF